MNLRHAPEPIQVQLAGNTLEYEWVPNCCCGWRDPLRHHLDNLAAVAVTMEHISHCPESWETA